MHSVKCFFLNWHLKNFLHRYSGSKFLWGGRLWQFDTRVLRKYLMERILLSRSKSRSLWSHYSQFHASLDCSTGHPKSVHASLIGFKIIAQALGWILLLTCYNKLIPPTTMDIDESVRSDFGGPCEWPKGSGAGDNKYVINLKAQNTKRWRLMYMTK